MRLSYTCFLYYGNHLTVGQKRGRWPVPNTASATKELSHPTSTVRCAESHRPQLLATIEEYF